VNPKLRRDVDDFVDTKTPDFNKLQQAAGAIWQ
jgi:hypothetical protein